MQIIRQFHLKFIEQSHIKIGLQLLKLWNLEVQFLGSHSISHLKYGKIEHKNW